MTDRISDERLAEHVAHYEKLGQECTARLLRELQERRADEGTRMGSDEDAKRAAVLRELKKRRAATHVVETHDPWSLW